MFSESQYKIFFDRPIKDQVLKYKHFETAIFHRGYVNKNTAKGFMFVYTIVAPSKKWEGMQGFISLDKINGKYKITGIETIP